MTADQELDRVASVSLLAVVSVLAQGGPVHGLPHGDTQPFWFRAEVIDALSHHEHRETNDG